MKYFHPKKWYRISKVAIVELIVFYLLTDKMYLKLKFTKVFGKKLNLNNPQTFNEKIQWLKLNDRDPLYHDMVDKYEVKKIVANMIGDEYIIPTLGVWNSFDEIDFDSLPDQFVMKCNHDSASTIICKNKSNFDYSRAKQILANALRHDYYRFENRQWAYKGIKRKIIAEKLLFEESGEDLKDYKFFCFNGEVKFIQVDINRFSNHKRNIYDLDWNLQDFQIQYPNDKNFIIEKPGKLDEMISLAEKLSKGIVHVRVDFYYLNNKIFFGELTFYHGGGTERFYPDSWDFTVGSWMKLS